MNSKRRISPAIVISILALFVAIGGTSYAAVKINGKNIKKGTVAGKALKKNTITGKQVNEKKLGKVPTAKLADTATNATNAEGAKTAEDAEKLNGKTAAELASPAAFAYINAGGADPEVPADSALGITAADVTKENSFVCIKGLDFEPRNVAVTTYRIGGGTTNDIANVTLDDNNFCEGAEQVAVQMVDGETGAPNSSARFYVTLFR